MAIRSGSNALVDQRSELAAFDDEIAPLGVKGGGRLGRDRLVSRSYLKRSGLNLTGLNLIGGVFQPQWRTRNNYQGVFGHLFDPVSTQVLNRPRLLRHYVEAYAASAAG